jgi:signal transduction histidine kinase
MMTAHSSLTLVVEFMKAGGNEFIEKPINFAILEVKIQQALQHTKLKLQLYDARAAIQAAKQASQLKSQFLSSMSHELRTPLNSIVVYIQSLQIKLEKDKLTDTKLKEALKTMNESGKLLSELIEDVLDFSRIESGKKQVNISAVNLGQVMDNLGSALRNSAEAKGLTLEIRIPDDFPLIAADPKLLKQVITNLIGNAIKFTDAGNINVAAELIPGDEKNVKISVSDTGIGISKGFQKNIFSDFFQADSERKGTGLGLAIAEKLVKLMGGEIRVESEIGKGSTFFFTLKKG